MKSNEVLLTLAYKYEGNWTKIYNAISTKEDITEAECDAAIKKLAASGISAITIMDEDYPECLKQIPQPPFVLFCRGDHTLMNDKNEKLAIIGTRDEMLKNEFIIQEMVEEHHKKFGKRSVIISGFSRGVGTKAHEAAIKSGAKTIAVYGCGVQMCYPAANKSLEDEIIKKGGLIVSEYPDSVAPSPSNFQERTRIIAGISKYVFTPEITEHSGSQAIIEYALAQNKEIFVSPITYGIMKMAAARGKEIFNNELIKSGAATLIDSGESLVNAIVQNY